jgi:hypothetical protein
MHEKLRAGGGDRPSARDAATIKPPFPLRQRPSRTALPSAHPEAPQSRNDTTLARTLPQGHRKSLAILDLFKSNTDYTCNLTPSRSKARCWISVGLASSAISGALPYLTVLREGGEVRKQCSEAVNRQAARDVRRRTRVSRNGGQPATFVTGQSHASDVRSARRRRTACRCVMQEDSFSHLVCRPSVSYWNLMIRPEAARLKNEEASLSYCSGGDFAVR